MFRRIPDDWQLTSQQQAFIELFAEMISRNNNYHHSYYPFLMNYGLLIHRSNNRLSYLNTK